MDIQRYSFRLSFFNELAAVDEHFQLFYYVRRDGRDEIEINDVKHKKKFLSRVHYPALKLSDIVIDGKVTVYGRQYRVAGYEDDFTRKALGRGSERCFGLISAAGVRAGALGDTWSAIEASGLRVARAKMLHLTQADVPAVASGMTEPSLAAAGMVIAFELLGEDPAGVWGSVCSLLPGGHLGRALPAHDERLRQAFFGPAAGRIASATEVPAVMGGGCSCVLILPSTVAAGNAGAVLTELGRLLADPSSSKGGGGGDPLAITALGTYDLTRVQAAEFLEVYRDVLPAPELHDLISEYCSGPLVALEVCGEGATERVRGLAGPRDVDVAKMIRPQTLRAKFGAGPARPGLHVTDLAEDGPLESEYIFSILESTL